MRGSSSFRGNSDCQGLLSQHSSSSSDQPSSGPKERPSITTLSSESNEASFTEVGGSKRGSTSGSGPSFTLLQPLTSEEKQGTKRTKSQCIYCSQKFHPEDNRRGSCKEAPDRGIEAYNSITLFVKYYEYRLHYWAGNT